MSPRVQLTADEPLEPEAPLLKVKAPRQRASGGLGSLPIRRTAARRSDDRHQVRRKCDGVRARLEHAGAISDVQLLNLSKGGAMIGCDLHPNIAERVTLHLGESDMIECLVRWVREQRIGLEFAHETQLRCSDQEQAAVLYEAIAGSGDRPLQMVHQKEDRSASRHPLIWSGQLVQGARSWKVRLRNVSPGGALVEGAIAVQAGTELLLDLGAAGAVKATVRWTAQSYAGLEFEQAFDLSLLGRTRPRVVPHTWLRPAYLEKDVPEDSPWDKGWNRKSLAEVREDLEGFLKY